MCVFNSITKLIAPIPDVEKFDSFLFVGPHPDDIEIGAGGTVAKLAADGKKITFLIATDGRYGTDNPSITCEDLAVMRKKEAISAAELLGVTDVRFLDYPDGGNYDVFALTQDICKVICQVKPDVVFAPDFAVISEFHIDHTNVGKACANAFVMAGAKYIAEGFGLTKTVPAAIALYYTDKPNRYVKMAKYKNILFDAVKKHESQFPTQSQEEINTLKAFGLYLKFRAFRLGFRRFSTAAEGFRVLAAIHVHCCPEVNWF